MTVPSNPERVIIVGASARAAAFSALAAGFTPYTIDWFADRDLRNACEAVGGQAVRIQKYPHDFLANLANAPAAPWVYTGGLENYPRLIERLADLRTLWGNRGIGLRSVRDPAKLAEVAEQVGLGFPQTATTGEELESVPNPGAEWLVKPQCSSGGISIRRATAADFRRARPGSYLQRHVPGQSASALYVAARGSALLLGCSRQIIGSDIGEKQRPFLYAGSIAPLHLPPEQSDALSALGHRLADAFGLVGLFGVDFVAHGGGLWILEVNPRYTASVEVLEQATGAPCFGLHVAACTRGEIPRKITPDAQQFAGKRIVYARRDTVVPASFEELVRYWNRCGEPLGIADLPCVGDMLRAGQPVVSIFAAGKTLSAVERLLHERSEVVQRHLLQGTS